MQKIGPGSLVLVVALSACPTESPAQEFAPAPASRCVIDDDVPAVCVEEFNAWWTAEGEWRDWMALHQNRFASIDGQPKKRPSPPAWLVEYCAGTTDQDLKSEDFCPRYNALKEFDPRLEERNRKVLLQLHGEQVKKTKWLQRIHLDGPWSASQWPSYMYGVIGMHVAMEVEGRFEIFLAPGVLLFNMSRAVSANRWSPAWDYGVGLRLFDFRIPGVQRTATLHFNLAKAWTFDGLVNNADVMGLSTTFKMPPPRKPGPPGQKPSSPSPDSGIVDDGQQLP